MSTSPAIRRRGRPRAFNEAQVLDSAIELFSSAGFSAAAIDDLKAATGLAVGSLYKAYQDKAGLFAQALERYVSVREAAIAATLGSAANGRERLVHLLKLYAMLSQGKRGRVGCMVVAGVIELDQDHGAAARLREVLMHRRGMLAEFVAQGQQDGSIATTQEPEQIANLLLALLQGMRVVGKAGLFPRDADRFVSLAMKVLE